MTRAPDHVLERAPTRWTALRKAELVQAVAAGEIARKDALARFGVSGVEFDAWAARYAMLGPAGLRSTRLQAVRAIAGGAS